MTRREETSAADVDGRHLEPRAPYLQQSGGVNAGKQDAWRDLVESVAADDELPTREAGDWTADKLWFWHRYIEITTTAMVGKPAWKGGVLYADLFAGPGVCKLTADAFPVRP